MNVGSIMRDMVLGGKSTDVRNALSEGTDSAGGYTVPTHLLEQLIDLMRSKTRVVQAGAQTVMLETEETHIARLISDPVPAWRLEAAAVAESAPTFDRVSFTARSLAVLVKASRELLEDSVNIETALMNALAQALAGEMDRVALYGSGSAPEPKGVYSATGVNVVDMGTNGAVLSNHSKILSAVEKLSTANSAMPTAAIMHPRTFYTQAGFVATDGQPLNRPAVLAPLPYLETIQVPIDQTQGTETDASSVIVGDFTQMMLGLRSTMRIEILRELYAEPMEFGFIAHLRADVAIAQPKAFTKIVGIIPAA